MASRGRLDRVLVFRELYGYVQRFRSACSGTGTEKNRYHSEQIEGQKGEENDTEEHIADKQECRIADTKMTVELEQHDSEPVGWDTRPRILHSVESGRLEYWPSPLLQLPSELLQLLLQLYVRRSPPFFVPGVLDIVTPLVLQMPSPSWPFHLA